MPNAKLAILMAASFTAVIHAHCWRGTAPAAVKGICGASLRGLRLVTTLILMVLTTSLWDLRLSTTLHPRGLATLILMVLALLKSARLAPVGGPKICRMGCGRAAQFQSGSRASLDLCCGRCFLTDMGAHDELCGRMGQHWALDDAPEPTGAPMNEVMIDEFLSAVRTSQPSEPSPASLLEQIRSSPAFLQSLESPGLFEICAGRGTLSDAYDAEGITPRLLSETDEFDRRYPCFRFPSPAFVLDDFFLGQWQCSASVLVVTGGISCAFCSPAGLQLGTRDLRSPISTDALPWAARYFNAAFADFENAPAIATADHGSVLRALDHNFATVGYERVPRMRIPARARNRQPQACRRPGGS